MRRSHLLILAAWLLYGPSWFLPAFHVTLGWEAFIMESTALFRPFQAGSIAASEFRTRYQLVLSAASVITNLLFVVGTPWTLLRGSRSLRQAFAWAAAAAFLINAHWHVLSTADVDLGVGYFLWWWSFLVLAVGFFDLAGRNEAAGSTHS